MSRLTHRNENGEARVWLYSDHKNMARVLDEQSRKEVEVLEKLAHYEDLADEGGLIELPCAKGTTVYLVYKYDDEILKLFSNEPKYYIIKTTFKEFLFSSFGDTVFLTKDEAEQKLAELKGGAE